jgi:menaquinone-9 beta-reductase
MTPRAITVIGGGPAGCAAALAALDEGASVTVYEKSRLPRHKVCGEFLSPEILPLIESLGLHDSFFAARPARLSRVVLRMPRREKTFSLPEPAYSLSRFALDRLLLEEAASRGAEVMTQARKADAALGPVVIAHGRQAPAPKGNRLFGFKAHFRGPVEEAVEMFFFRGGYAGVSPVEEGAVNVCGLAPEESLRAAGFRPEEIFPESLRERLARLERSFDWLVTGPLVFQEKFDRPSEAYLAGDALAFVDPFTGSGILSALATGKLAGRSAARRTPVAEYNGECRRILGRQYGVSALMRRVLGDGLAAEIMLNIARWIPGAVLYRLTRPAVPKTSP